MDDKSAKEDVIIISTTATAELPAVREDEPETLSLLQRVTAWSRAIKGWAAAISVVGATALSITATLQTDPEAVAAKGQSEETWKVAQAQLNTVVKELNRLSAANSALQESVRKLSLRVVFLQAHEAGMRNGEARVQLMQLQQENARLRQRRDPPAATAGSTSCRAGHILVGSHCRRVSKPVAAEVLAARAEAAAAEKRATAESRLRKKAEADKITVQATSQPAPKIKLLPRKLGAAVKLLQED